MNQKYGEYRVRMATLMAEFSKFRNDEPDLAGPKDEWRFHPSCATFDQAPGDRFMLLKTLPTSIGVEDAIIMMDPLGYRPATHLELRAFRKEHLRVEEHRFPVIALGSWRGDSVRYFECVAFCPARFSVCGPISLGENREPHDRFLWVRK